MGQINVIPIVGTIESAASTVVRRGRQAKAGPRPSARKGVGVAGARSDGLGRKRSGYDRRVSSVMLLVPHRAQINEAEARELIKRLELLASERGMANAISRLQHALSDDSEQTLAPVEATAIHNTVVAWLAEDSPLEPAARDRLEKLRRATSAR